MRGDDCNDRQDIDSTVCLNASNLMVWAAGSQNQYFTNLCDRQELKIRLV